MGTGPRSGKWQNGDFDLRMEQGSEGSESGVWVERLIYRNKLRSPTIAHAPSLEPEP
jgi:hypothetical protein